MGAIRLCLALLVATAHLAAVVKDIPEILSEHAVTTVRLFFILSGSYMAMVLQQGRYARPLDFYTSRLMKLLPMYWIVSAMYFAAAAAVGHQFFPLIDPLPAWHRVNLAAFPASTVAYIATTLVTLIGSDTWTWLAFDSSTGAWSYSPAYGSGATSPLVLSAVPQAWTIGLELWFYLLAPFLARTRTIWLLTAIALRSACEPALPYDRCLFVLELPFFLIGMIAFRVCPALTWIATRLGTIDAELGALSYPAYISHLLVFAVLYQASVLSLPWAMSLPLALTSLIAFSIVLDRLIARPVDGLRARLWQPVSSTVIPTCVKDTVRP